MAIDEGTGRQLATTLQQNSTAILIGGGIGLLTGGLWGAILGAGVLVALRQLVIKLMQGEHGPQQVFFRATFAVMGKVAKADGQVTEDEIRFATDVMDRMNLSGARRQEAIDHFNMGKAEVFELASVLNPLVRYIQNRTAVKIMFIEIQLQVAMADGELSAAELAVIQQVCALLRMSADEMAALMARMQAQQAFFQHSYSQHQQGQFRQPADDHVLLSEAYGVLGVSAKASDAEVKKAYRRLMSQHHPDKLVAKGLPAEMMQLAKEKTQEIQAAYDRIKSARNPR